MPASQGLQFVNLVEYCASIHPISLSNNNNTPLGSSGDSSAQSSPDVDTKVRAVVAQKMAALGLSNATPTTTATGVSAHGNKTASQDALNNNQRNNTNVGKRKSMRKSDSSTDTFQLNHALLHQAFPPPPPTPATAGTVNSAPVMSQPEMQTPLASVPPRAGSARRSTVSQSSTTSNTKNNSSNNTLSSNKKQVKTASTTEPPADIRSPARPPVALKHMNLSTVTNTTVTSTTVGTNNDTVSAQLTAMFEEVNTAVQEKTSFVQSSQEMRSTTAPVSANATSKYGKNSE